MFFKEICILMQILCNYSYFIHFNIIFDARKMKQPILRLSKTFLGGQI